MKRKIEEITSARGTLFTSASIDQLDPKLSNYLLSSVAQSATFDSELRAYKYTNAGATVTCGGLINTLKYAYYPKYEDNYKKRRHKGSKLVGSTSKQGKQIDSEIAAVIEGRLRKKPHPMAEAVLKHIKLMGHSLQAAQVPVPLANNSLKMTQADLITRDAFGQLWLWEIKSGQKIGFFRKQKQQAHFDGKLKHVDCNGLNIWHLQLQYTRLAIEAQNVPISQARIIQVYKHKDKGIVVKVHEQPKWIKDV
ncbi:MAG: hypothetical protein K2Q45_03185 [Nitrosomonas sp.]|nr:hypothetical protein [Nitrosomonas sp.]